MTEYLDFNLNDNILVKINDKGYEHWMNQHNKVFVDFYEITKNEKVKENMKDLAYFKKKKRKDGYVQFQGWQFMEIFGEATGMGMPMLFATTIKIEITKP